MKKPVRNLILLVIVAVIAAALAFRLNVFKTEKGNNDTNPKEKKQETIVKAYIVKNEVLEDKVVSVGTVVSNEEVKLTAEAAGRITEIYFKEGSSVSKGQLLLKINDAELQSQLKKAQVQKELLEKKKQRDEQLHARQGISDEDFESTVADLQTKIAEIEVIKSQIEKTRLIAPFSGMIGIRHVSEGSYLNPGTPIADLIDYSTIKIDFSIPEKYMGQVSKGNKVFFSVAGNNKEYQALVYAVEPKIDLATRTINIRAVTANPGNEILPGAFANVRIVLNQIDNALMIPSEALIPELDIKKVYRLQQGKAEPVIVKTGIRTENKVQVVEGIQPGDTVIISGILQIKPGANVKIATVQ